MRWKILALLFFARVGLGFQFQTVASVSDGLSADFGLDYTDVGMMIGLFMAPGLVLALPAGFSGRFASDRLLAGGGLLSLALGSAVTAAAVDPTFAGIGRLLSGVGFVFCNLYFTKMIADWFDGREIATAMSILVMSWPFGIAMGQVGHTWLAEAFNWRFPFAAASAYCLVVALGVFMFYRSPNHSARIAAPQGSRLLPREWGLILCAGMAWAVFNAGYVIYLSFGPDMLETHGLSVLAAASVISVGSWLMILSGAACGVIADRFNHVDVILTVCIASAIASLMLLTVPGMGLAASTLIGLLGIAPAGIIMALTGQAVAPERRAFGMGIFFTIYHVVMTGAPPVAGALYETTGAPTAALVFGMGLFAMVLPAVFIFRKLKATRQVIPVQEGQ